MKRHPITQLERQTIAKELKRIRKVLKEGIIKENVFQL